MANYFYEGNLNEQVNYHKKGDIEYYVRGTLEVNGRIYERYGKKTESGIGITEPYKLQLMIDMNGMGKVLYAGAVGMLGKLMGKHGIFYKILGEESAEIDGFYSHSAFKEYSTMAILVPQKAGEVCDEIFEEFHIPSMIVDANDISVNILGKCNMLKDISDEALAAYIRDNPAGQDDEMTPFIVIRDITGQKSQPYTPKKPRKQV